MPNRDKGTSLISGTVWGKERTSFGQEVSLRVGMRVYTDVPRLEAKLCLLPSALLSEKYMDISILCRVEAGII